VKRGICPIATLYSLAAAYKGSRCKQSAIIFHGGRVVVTFVQKFVAMATGVGKKEILTTPSDNLGPKIGGLRQIARNYLLRRPSYTALKSPYALMQNFATFEWLLWQQGSMGVNSNNTVRLPDPENMGVDKHSGDRVRPLSSLHRP